MILAKPTENLTGVTVEGSFDDFYEAGSKRISTVIFLDYAAQYVDKCNLEYLKTIPEKRKDKLRNIAKRFIKQPVSYKKLKSEFEYSAKQHNCSMHELYDPKMEYPEEILW